MQYNSLVNGSSTSLVSGSTHVHHWSMVPHMCVIGQWFLLWFLPVMNLTLLSNRNCEIILNLNCIETYMDPIYEMEMSFFKARCDMMGN
jgi:hypothetical protein